MLDLDDNVNKTISDAVSNDSCTWNHILNNLNFSLVSLNTEVFFDNLVISIFIAFTLCSIVYATFNKYVKAILAQEKLCLTVGNQRRLKEALWNFTVLVSSILIILFALGEDMKYWKLQINLKDIFRNNELFSNEDEVSDFFKFTFTILWVFCFHCMYVTVKNNGYVAEYYTKLCYLIFFTTAYNIRYLRLGFMATLLINFSALWQETAKIFCILNKDCNKLIVKYIAIVIFLNYCCIWAVIFMYLLPKYFLWPSSSVKVPASKIIPMFILTVGLWSFFIMQLWTMPLLKAMKFVIWKNENNDWIESALFQPPNDIQIELFNIRKKIKENERKYRNRYSPGNTEESRKSVVMYQTLRCVMKLQKKFRDRRQMAAKVESENNQNNEESCLDKKEEEGTEAEENEGVDEDNINNVDADSSNLCKKYF